MLDLETGLHAKCGAFLDCERVLIEVVQRAGLGQIDDNVWASLDLKTQRQDNAFPWVVWVRDART